MLSKLHDQEFVLSTYPRFLFSSSFEEELRRIDNTVSLPYWDFTIDSEMDNPVNSIIWSSKMYGNGNGKIKTGDFKEWLSPKGPLQRRYGESNYGRLINRDTVRDIVSKCRTQVRISYLTRQVIIWSKKCF